MKTKKKHKTKECFEFILFFVYFDFLDICFVTEIIKYVDSFENGFCEKLRWFKKGMLVGYLEIIVTIVCIK